MYSWMAAPTSPRWRAVASDAMPAHSDPSVTSDRRCRSATTSGRVSSGSTAVNAESPFHPLYSAPASIDRMSPGASTRSPGMPCTTCSLTDAQMVWRYPRTIWKFDFAPRPVMTSDAAASSSAVVTPGAIRPRTASRAAAVMRPGSTIARSWAGDL